MMARERDGARIDMEDLFSIHPGIARTTISGAMEWLFNDGVEAADGCGGEAADYTDHVKAKIASHPRYPALLSAYIDCRKVGATPEMAMLLEEIARERSGDCCGNESCVPAGIAADPELDNFMDSYCRTLVRYKDELAKPVDEAMSFLSGIEAQLGSLCKPSSVGSSSSSATSGVAGADEVLGSSEEEPNYEDDGQSESYGSPSRVPDNEMKDLLLKKYSGYISKLKREFLKKRKKGSIPRDARLTLLDWWNSHYHWPYPTEDEKIKLAEDTGLDQKQINNWFINQRKRHWKPSDSGHLALVEEFGPTNTLCFETGSPAP